MSGFLQLPDESPAEPLMLALVHLGDMLAEHGDLLPPETTERTFRQVCSAALELLNAHKRSEAGARQALASASAPR